MKHTDQSNQSNQDQDCGIPIFIRDQLLLKWALGQSALRNVTSSLTKYYHVTTTLPQEIANGIINILRTPPTETPYEILNNRFIKWYGLTEYRRAEQLVNLPSLRDRKPWQLINSMLALVPENYVPDFLFNHMFLQRLPADIRARHMGIYVEVCTNDNIHRFTLVSSGMKNYVCKCVRLETNRQRLVGRRFLNLLVDMVYRMRLHQVHKLKVMFRLSKEGPLQQQVKRT